ncbi:hypothetical protein ABIF38_008821 [Bradyrhizobium japonicum]|jgi:hypothetical protein|uniref:hypothetical protein n=1 Tax=Bradyrhizobium TaxID=374 RepID=UPI00036B6C0C|nr:MULTISPECIES: hypothetical protein [Bradyrhizobium]MCP1728861.1 hypothetical protein [Bradyrhizobium elkanii]MCS3452341.1 hypothetical protein [Bradyrhizobium elkanii]MCS3565556.1 hypothetical protein [Bradyrhizobium elkanii]MCS3572985.1 hypothetical protein [Bradyrhizobium elkanii]MCS3594322.1 hypothetical protein [Bradyrhizobium elkanii]
MNSKKKRASGTDITLSSMVEFITERVLEPSRVIVDRNLLRLYLSADGMMHDEFWSAWVEGRSIGLRRPATSQIRRDFTTRSTNGLL